MNRICFYCIAGSFIAATAACSSTDTVATTDATTVETSETVRAAGNTTDETTTTDTGTTESDSMDNSETTGTTTGTDTGISADMTVDMATLTDLDDATFMMTAASSNMLEIQLGKMVAEKAADPKVKEFAQMMVDHHTKANQEVKTLATSLGVTLPTTLMPMHQAMINDLSGKTGTAFEEEYINTIESAHRMDITMFEAKSRNASSGSVKTFAQRTLLKLKTHQQIATTI